MRALVQRVLEAGVVISGSLHSQIGQGLLVLLGVEEADTQADASWLAQKVAQLRIFADEEGKMNRNITDVEGQILVVSQFTLHASTQRGNRPSFIRAAQPDKAIPLYELFVQQLATLTAMPVATGVFGADMKIPLVNDGPVTIWLDSKNRE